MLALELPQVAHHKQDLFHRLMSGVDTAVYVLGRNKYAQRIARVFAVRAFIDDFTRARVYLDRPVIRMSELPRDGIVVSCVMDTLPVTALDRLQAVGARQVIDYFTLTRLAPEVFAPVDFCAGNAEDILANVARYQSVYDLLADETRSGTSPRWSNFVSAWTRNTCAD